LMSIKFFFIHIFIGTQHHSPFFFILGENVNLIVGLEKDI